ncbi:aminotransferase class III-fold pyridoxal phosphate-dependent enzyme, partial [Pseudomonas syringae group genomosp. 7]|uniref:aminotransferase class III-fold pyridoxal phosphate-dependent enzyme n=1 Tax=Pseudomonas syringae group genomosp. 7 TaxID=251699 RepID=UPI0037702673
LLDNLPKGGLGGTYSGNPIGCAAGLASLAQMTHAKLSGWGEQQENAIVARYDAWQASKLFPCLGRLTGVGCMRGIELITPEGDPGTRQLADLLGLAREAGLLL